MRLQKLLPLLLVVVVAGCGGDDSSSGSGSGADPATAIPATVAVYVEGVVRPEGEQGDNVRELLDRFLGDTSVEELIDRELAAENRTYAEDIEPWLGGRAAIGVADLAADEPAYVGALQITDQEAAETALTSEDTVEELGEYEGTTIYDDGDVIGAVTEDFFLFADNREQVELAIRQEEADALSSDQRFADAVDELPEERLGALYVNTAAFGQAVAADIDPAARGIVDQFFGEDAAPITAALTAQPDAATIEARVGASTFESFGSLFTGEATDQIADAPAGSVAVFGYQDLGASFKATLDRFAGALGGAALTGQIESETGINLDRDLFSWIGDVTVFVRGETVQELDGALVIEQTDPDAAAAAIPRLVAAARRDGAPVQPAQVEGADEAFAVPGTGLPGPLLLAYNGERTVLAVGEQAAADALNPTETIADSGLYDRAQEDIDGIAPSAIVDVGAVVALAEADGATSDPSFQEAKPYLEMLDLLVTGTEQDGDFYRGLFTVSVTEAG